MEKRYTTKPQKMRECADGTRKKERKKDRLRKQSESPKQSQGIIEENNLEPFVNILTKINP